MTIRRKRGPEPRTEDHAAGLPLRVAMMDLDRRKQARRLRRKGLTPEAIATKLNASPEEVAAALGAMRGRRQGSNHVNLSVTRLTGEFFRSLAEPGEPTWQLMDRVAIMLRGMLRPDQRRTPPTPPPPSNDDGDRPQRRLLGLTLALALLGAPAAQAGACILPSGRCIDVIGGPAGWSGLPPAPDRSRWHRLAQGFDGAAPSLHWWDAASWSWRVMPGGAHGASPTDMRIEGTRYIAPEGR